MSVKVSQMPEATELKDGDLLMIVQDGQNKKIPASKFQPSDEPAENALQFQGYTASDFVKSADGIAYDSNRLGGVPASNYATKSYVDSAKQNSNSWMWCCPQLWFSAESGKFPKQQTLIYPNDQTDPNKYGITANFAVCAGQWLSQTDYPDLYACIGNAFDGIQSYQGMFRLPDLRGKFAFGADLNQSRHTENLPSDLYVGKDGFNAQGQWKYPQDVGNTGGDPTTTQECESQMASHKHGFELNYNHLGGNSSYEDNLIGDGTAKDEFETMESGSNVKTYANPYPNTNFTPAHYNYGMLSMPPFLTFAYIMQIKPFE